MPVYRLGSGSPGHPAAMSFRVPQPKARARRACSYWSCGGLLGQPHRRRPLPRFFENPHQPMQQGLSPAQSTSLSLRNPDNSSARTAGQPSFLQVRRVNLPSVPVRIVGDPKLAAEQRSGGPLDHGSISCCESPSHEISPKKSRCGP